MRAWLSMVRSVSSLLTILLVSLLQCVKVDTLGTPCEADLDWVPNHFIYFYITDKLCFYFLISFWYPYFLLLSMNPLACNWELSPPLLPACHSKHLFCPFQCDMKGEMTCMKCFWGTLVSVRATGAQDSRRILRYITVCDYDTTHLQENPQRLGWGSWRDLLHYIY